MNEPVWVRDDVAVAVHRRQLAEHGGLDGIRDVGLLSSAMARPRNRFAYGGSVDVADRAGAYAFGIIKNHPFVDGNKRTGYVVALLFVRLNGFRIDAAPIDKYRVLYDIAAGTGDESNLAGWLREHLVAS